MTGTSTGGPNPGRGREGSDPTQANIDAVVANFAPNPTAERPEPDYSVREASLSRAYQFKPDAAKVIGEIEKAYPEIGQAMEAVWAHPSKTLPDAVPYNHYADCPSDDRFLNIPEHAAAGIMVASAIGKYALTDQTQLAELQRRAATDPLTKVGESLRREAGVKDVYSPSAYESEREYLIEGRGIPARVADLIVSKHEVTGHRSFANFIEVNPDGTFTVPVNDRTIIDCILHLSDNMVHSTKPKQAEMLGEEPVTAVFETIERMSVSLFHHPDFKVGYPWMWDEGLGRTSDGQIVEIKDVRNPDEGITVIGSFAYLQGAINTQIAEALENRITSSGAASNNGKSAGAFILELVTTELKSDS